MKTLINILCFILFAGSGFCQNTIPTEISRIQPALDKLIAKDAQLEKIPGKYKFTEGPAWNKAGGFIIFSDIPANVIYTYKNGEEPAVYMDNAGYTGTDSIFINNPGSNGLVYDAAGNLYVCRHGDRNVVKIAPDNSTEIIASQFNGKRFNSPNDVAVKSNGVVYFTDPPYAAKGKNRVKELTFSGIYKVFNGQIQLIDSTFSYPNGVALTPDEKYLLASSSDGKNKIFRRYKLDKQGNVLSSELFFDANSLEGKNTPDGFKFDKKGNVYAAGPGGLLIISSKGVLLGIVKISEGVTNCAFGDSDGKTLYITARTNVYKIKTLVGGW
jgi:gluconolactonase